MSRIKIQIPQNLIGSFTIPVRISDINYGNHVGNDAFISLIHEARVQWLKQHHYSELQIEGVGLIMGELAVEFKNESFYGDVVEISIYAGELSKVSFELFYQLITQRNNEPIILANAKTGMICFNYTTKKVTALPTKLISILNS